MKDEMGAACPEPAWNDFAELSKGSLTAVDPPRRDLWYASRHETRGALALQIRVDRVGSANGNSSLHLQFISRNH